MPANTVALALLLIVVIALLVLQPDFGQTMLIALVWGALFFMAGMRLIWVVGLGGDRGASACRRPIYTVPHVARRINRFLDPSSGDTFKIDIATESFVRGGWFGRGPGEGTVKRILPESHTDFVFAVAARGVRHRALPHAGRLVRLHRDPRAACKAMRNEDPFIRFAAAGLAILFGAAVGHQHGGEPASDAGQGHDVAVHLLRRLVDDLARLRHGHAAGADARAAARAICPPSGAAARRERGLMPAAGGRAPVLAGRRRNRRPSVSRRGAGRGARRGAASRSHLATDARAARYGGAFPTRAMHVIPSATMRGAQSDRAGADRRDAWPRRSCRRWCLIGRLKPAAVVGFGGYPTLPPLLAAALRGMPTVIHEQNAVMGRANRLLAPRVTAIATSFPDVLARSAAARRQGDAHRQSGAAGGGRRRRARPIRRR